MRTDASPPIYSAHADILRRCLARVSDLLAAVEDPDAAVPTVPGVRARTVLAYLVEQAARAQSQHAWTGIGYADDLRAVTSDAGWAELIGRWQAAIAAVGETAADDVEFAARAITALTMAEHDLRTVLDTPGARDDDAVRVALDVLAGELSDRVADSALPPLRVTVEQWGTIAGEGYPQACVVADRFEFVRGISGRRAASEISRWNWGLDPEVYLDVLVEGSLPAEEIHERDPRVPEHMRDREFVL